MLLGPPAAGKFNILDAAALAGYFNKLLLLEEEYDNAGSQLEPLTNVARFSEYKQLFRFHQLTKKISISLATKESRFAVEIFYEKGQLRVRVNGVDLRWDLKTLPASPMQEVRGALEKYVKALDLYVEKEVYDKGLSLTRELLVITLIANLGEVRRIRTGDDEWRRYDNQLTELSRKGKLGEFIERIRQCRNMLMHTGFSLENNIEILFENDKVGEIIGGIELKKNDLKQALEEAVDELKKLVNKIS